MKLDDGAGLKFKQPYVLRWQQLNKEESNSDSFTGFMLFVRMKSMQDEGLLIIRVG